MEKTSKGGWDQGGGRKIKSVLSLTPNEECVLRKREWWLCWMLLMDQCDEDWDVTAGFSKMAVIQDLGVQFRCSVWGASLIRVGSRETRKRGIGKSEKKRMMNMIIMSSITGLGKVSRGQDIFPWVLKCLSRKQPPVYLCISMYSWEARQGAKHCC